MRSKVAEEVRREQTAEELRLSPEDRLRLALQLGMRDLTLYAEAEAISLDEARRRLAVQASVGRRPSVANAP